MSKDVLNVGTIITLLKTVHERRYVTDVRESIKQVNVKRQKKDA